jgi:hypothetical protein
MESWRTDSSREECKLPHDRITICVCHSALLMSPNGNRLSLLLLRVQIDGCRCTTIGRRSWVRAEAARGASGLDMRGDRRLDSAVERQTIGEARREVYSRRMCAIIRSMDSPSVVSILKRGLICSTGAPTWGSVLSAAH